MELATQRDVLCSKTLTKVAVDAVGPVSSGLACEAPAPPSAAVQPAGLGDGGDQVLVVSVSPAPPADLGLAAAGDHRPVPLVPGRERREESRVVRVASTDKTCVHYW